ncbi:MAG TPA: DUF3052 family protein [Candidatus Limnocylindrales bacterium]|nr:DUF3052 family protein [Candidatus Limnocylindrales bacterium]
MPETERERTARYAARDVVDKLGVKPGDAVLFAGATRDPDLIARIRRKAGRAPARASEKADVVVFWPRGGTEVTTTLRQLRERVSEAGGIWVITAKRNKERAGRPYLGDDVMALGLAAGLVDNKVCAVSEIDTAIRFVIRRADRRA